MRSAAELRLFADIEAQKIRFQLVEHEPVFTVEESRQLDRKIPGVHTKNLFLKDSGGRFWLVTVPAQLRVHLKRLPEAIGCKRVSFGNADDMLRLLGIQPGSVTPLAALNDHEGLVTVVLDERLLDAAQTNVHPLRNSATLGLAPADLVQLLEGWRHKPFIATIPTIED
jgi:Ala-tRNA(Pro) deacylase